jgi:hypothetical protein
VREPLRIAGIGFEAFDLEPPLRAPAVGYRITAGEASYFYAPDVVAIHDEHEALAGIAAYVGDGAAVTRRAIVRRRDGEADRPRPDPRAARLVCRRDIGVSNYSAEQIEELVDTTGELPVVSQIEWSPFGWSPDMLD